MNVIKLIKSFLQQIGVIKLPLRQMIVPHYNMIRHFAGPYRPTHRNVGEFYSDEINQKEKIEEWMLAGYDTAYVYQVFLWDDNKNCRASPVKFMLDKPFEWTEYHQRRSLRFISELLK